MFPPMCDRLAPHTASAVRIGAPRIIRTPPGPHPAAAAARRPMRLRLHAQRAPQPRVAASARDPHRDPASIQRLAPSIPIQASFRSAFAARRRPFIGLFDTISLAHEQMEEI
ncbi:hypothetical protein [Burkholderia ubonensis]|uniref:hypothetical protein n=1 Tax=Burkholderia ubonensis TaxID=101571 RepID=UPI000AA82886|nr:hypothetical protein [Burkholderia ubonensis]